MRVNQGKSRKATSNSGSGASPKLIMKRNIKPALTMASIAAQGEQGERNISSFIKKIVFARHG